MNNILDFGFSNLDKELYGYWKMDTVESSVVDNDLNGTFPIADGPFDWLPQQTQNNSSRDFNSVNALYTTTVNSDIATKGYTVSVWLKPTIGAQYQTVVSLGSFNTNRFFVFRPTASSTDHFFRVWDSGLQGGSVPVDLDEWQHIAFSYNGDGMPSGQREWKVYKNGKLVDSFFRNRSQNGGSTSPWAIGGSDGSNWFNGKMSHLFIHERELSETEIQHLAIYPYRIALKK